MKKYAFLLLIFLLSSCREVAITGRKQMTLLPDDLMIQMGLSSYQGFLMENKEKVLTSGPELELVKKVGTNISRSVEQYLVENGMGDKVATLKWEFNVVENDSTANAWCMLGGKVVVYTGLLPVTLTEDGLAVVIGHEIAHAIADHGNERMSQNLLAQTGFIALDVALQDKPAETRDLFFTAYGLGSELGVLLPFSRTHETEADKLGLIFMAMAGYDPKSSIAFWERMAERSGETQPPQFLSTHPGNEKRISDLRSFLPEALKYYKSPK